MIKYFLDRFLQANLEDLSVNSRNDMKYYNEMDKLLERDLKVVRKRETKMDSIYENTPKTKPIDKKNFLNSVKDEINVIQIIFDILN